MEMVLDGKLFHGKSGFSVAECYLMPPLKTTVTKLSLNLVNRDIVIKVSRLGKTAGAIGASLLAKSRLLNKNL